MALPQRFLRESEFCEVLRSLRVRGYRQRSTSARQSIRSDSERLLLHFVGTDEDEVVLQSLAWSEKKKAGLAPLGSRAQA